MAYQLQIVKFSDPAMWYAGLVGQCVPFLGEWRGEGYRSREPNGYVNIVRYADARIVDDNGKPMPVEKQFAREIIRLQNWAGWREQGGWNYTALQSMDVPGSSRHGGVSNATLAKVQHIMDSDNNGHATTDTILAQIPMDIGPRTYRVMIYRYFDGMTFDQIKSSIGCGKDSALRMHRNGLEYVRDAVAGAAKGRARERAVASSLVISLIRKQLEMA